MRRRWLLPITVVALLSLGGCSTPPRLVNCDRHLVPINKPAPAKARPAGRSQSPAQPANSSREQR